MNADSRPNILYIFPDQLSARWVGCYGNANVATPALDGLAREGLRWNRAYSNSPVCTPYRSILMTGRYPHETGVVENGMALPKGVPTLAEYLNDAGYLSSYLGKWHLAGPPGGNRWVPPEDRAGFQRFTGWESHHVNHWDGRIFSGDTEPVEYHMDGHETDALADLACRELAYLAEVDQPFALFVSFQAPHPPCSPPEEFRKPYRGADLTLPNMSRDTVPPYYRPEWDADYSHQEFMERYAGEVTHVDAAISRILTRLDDLGLSNTLVIVTSDHGEQAGSHDLYGKGVLYEESVRVPLIVRAPGNAHHGTVMEVPFCSVDMLPTLVEIAGGKPEETLPGCSRAAEFLGVTDNPSATAGQCFFEYRSYRGIVSGDWKLIRDVDDPAASELYNLAGDPWEQHNLIGDTRFQTMKDRLWERTET